MKRRTSLLNTIVARRMMSGYSQESVADDIGVTQGQYSKFESGKARLPIEALDKLLLLLELEVIPSDTTSREEIAYTVHRLFKDNESVSRIRSLIEFLDGVIKEYNEELHEKAPHKFLMKKDED